MRHVEAGRLMSDYITRAELVAAINKANEPTPHGGTTKFALDRLVDALGGDRPENVLDDFAAWQEREKRNRQAVADVLRAADEESDIDKVRWNAPELRSAVKAWREAGRPGLDA